MTDVHRRTLKAARDVRRAEYADNVAEAVGPVERGCEIYGLSRGQYSLIDLIEHILSATGPADLTISTWTAAGADIDYALRLTKDGRVQSCKWIVDTSFPARQPGYCAAMREAFGDDAIRVTKSHAKFALVGNETWRCVLRTSMNLNENRRLESWELSDDAGLFAYLAGVVESLFREQLATCGFTETPSENERSFHAATESARDPRRRIRYIK
jgi:hypothetical protein